MDDENDFTNLMDFLEIYLNKESESILQDETEDGMIKVNQNVIEEVIVLLKNYAALKEESSLPDFLKKMEELEKERNKLEQQVKDYENEIYAHRKEAENNRKTISKAQNEFIGINETLDSQIEELEKKISDLENNNNELKKQLDLESSKRYESEHIAKMIETEKKAIFEELEKLKPEYEKMFNLKKDEENLLKQNLDLKSKECEALKIRNKKLSKERQKIMKNAGLVKQNLKANNTLINTLNREIADLREKIKNLNRQIEMNQIPQEESKFGRFVVAIEKTNYNRDDILSLLNKFKDEKIVVDKKEAIRVNYGESGLEKLSEYNDLFDNSMDSKDEPEKDVDVAKKKDVSPNEPVLEHRQDDNLFDSIEDSNLIDKKPHQNLTADHHIDTPKPRRKSKQDIDDDISKLLGETNMKKKSKAEIDEIDEKSNPFEKEDKSVPKDKISNLSDYEAVFMNDNYIEKKDIKKEVVKPEKDVQDEKINQSFDIDIKKQDLFKTEPTKPLSEYHKDSSLNQIEDVIKDLKGERTAVTLDSIIKQDEFNSLVVFTEDHLLTDKNPSTFILTGFEKRQMTAKYKTLKNKTLKKVFLVFIKLFINQINFLEGHISNLTNSNSYYQIRVEELKDEIEGMLKNFLARNKRNQDQLDKATDEFKKSRYYMGKILNSKVFEDGNNSEAIKKIKKKLNDGKDIDYKEIDKLVKSEQVKVEEEEEGVWKKFTSILPSMWDFFSTATADFATDFHVQRGKSCRTAQNVEWLHLDQYWLRYVCFSPNRISTLNVHTFGTLYMCNPCNAYTSDAAAFLKTLISNTLDVHN